MNEPMSIGALAWRTGMSVKTIRYYSEIGLVPESRRTRAGYRRYDAEALVRLELVRTLRELGLDIATIRAVLDRRADLPEVAAAHVEAIDAQVRMLRLRRAVLRRLADIGSKLTDQEVERMHRLAHASADERRRIVTEFLDHIFEGLDVDPSFEARFRSAMPELPDEPTDEQVDAWVELAELVGDPDFRARIRQMSEASWSSRDQRPETPTDPQAAMRAVATISERVDAARAAGVTPESPAASPIVEDAMAQFGAAFGPGDPLSKLESGTDARAERYWQLLAIINGWPPIPSRVPAMEWLIAALRARTESS